MTQIDSSENKIEIKSKSDDYSKAQEVISISSDSEPKNAEQKTEKALLWKSRPPKKCSKYIPEEVLEKHEIGWLSKRQAPFKNTPINALVSFEENLSSTEPCFSQGGNERTSVAMTSGTNCIAKHSSKIYSPSKTISSSISGLHTSIAKEVPSQGMFYNFLLFFLKRTSLIYEYTSLSFSYSSSSFRT